MTKRKSNPPFTLKGTRIKEEIQKVNFKFFISPFLKGDLRGGFYSNQKMKTVNTLKIRNNLEKVLSISDKTGVPVLVNKLKEKRLGKKSSTSVLRELRGILGVTLKSSLTLL